MKKTLLSLAFAMVLGGAAHAQTSTGPWSIVSVGSAVPVNYISEDIITVNAATVWVLYREVGAAGQPALPVRTYARTIDGGTTWTGGAINIPANLNVANITAIDGNTAWIAAFATGSGSIAQQGIYKTTDGGATWTRQATATFSTNDSFPNVVHFFDANNGVCMGDATPHAVNARLEVYTTTNGGTTWVRNNNAPQVQNLQEYGLVNSYFALGNTIWHGGVSDDGTGPTSGTGARLFKSTDRGLTWTAHDTDLAYSVSNIAFTNANNGLLGSGFELNSTTNGGVTNSSAAYTGTYRAAGLDAVPGLTGAYISVGVPQGGTSANNGSSISFDNGQTWTNMLPGTTSINQYEIDMLSPSVGYTGSFTQGTTAAPTVNLTGVTKLNSVITTSRNSAALKGVLQVFPNPSHDGRFALNVNLAGATKRDLTVTDALGRTVKHIKLNATGAAVQNQALDLSQCKAGVYTLRLETEQGSTVEKLVIK